MFPPKPGRQRLLSTVVLLAASLLVYASSTRACDFCLPGDSPLTGIGPNVFWALVDSVAACPAGDSVTALVPSRHPSKLRIEVWYDDINCQPRVGVPPESLSITWSTVLGNAAVNDEGAQIFADDSTDACGHTRFTIPTLSGCGKISVALSVSGRSFGSKNVVIRTVDGDATGRVDATDLFQTTCDVNYSGSLFDDATTRALHGQHWHRNALLGTLVRRTNYCETCPEEAVNTRGDSQISWSPGQRWIVHTAFVDAGQNAPSCKVFIVPADPKDGSTLTQLTSAPIWQHDYDPQWSPLNDVIVFDRADSVVMKKQVPWAGTTETAVTASNNCGCGLQRGDDIPSISPDGQWIAFSRCNPRFPCGSGGWSIWKSPIGGGTSIQLTPTAPRTDFYSSWSPDGQTIYFQRLDGNIGPQWTLWSVPAAGGTASQVFVPAVSPPDTFDAVQPALSPDGQVLLMGYGKRDNLVRNVVTHTLDPAISSPNSSYVIANYPDTNFAEKSAFPILTPRLSPDGTRLGLGSKQIWAARRNMSLPPHITAVGTQGVVDSTAKVSINAARGLQTTVQVLASDPESDALTCSAYLLQDGMSFDPGSCTLTWTPTLPIGTTVYVKFVVASETWPHASGGSDAILAALTVTSTSLPHAAMAVVENSRQIREGPNPTRGVFAITAPTARSGPAKLVIMDVSGRQVAEVLGASGGQLVWDGRARNGLPAGPGVYLYRVEVDGTQRTEGKITVVR